MKRVLIVSPWSGNVSENARIAEAMCLAAVLRGCAPQERELGMLAGLSWLAVADEVWCYTGHGISEGMKRELAAAGELGKPVRLFETCLQEETADGLETSPGGSTGEG